MPDLAPGIKVEQFIVDGFNALTPELQLEKYGFAVENPIPVGSDWIFTMHVGDMKKFGWDGYLSAMLNMKAFCEEMLQENPQSKIHTLFVIGEYYSLPDKDVILQGYSSLQYAPYVKAQNKGSIFVFGLEAEIDKIFKHDITREGAVAMTNFLFGAFGRSSKFRVSEVSSQDEVVKTILEEQRRKQQEIDDLYTQGLMTDSFSD